MNEDETEDYPRYDGVVMRPGIRVFCCDRDNPHYDSLGTLVGVRKHWRYWTFEVDFDDPEGKSTFPVTMDEDQIWPSDRDTEEAISWRASRQLKIFLCHGSEDKDRIRELYVELKKAEHQVWFDEESLEPGVEWDPAIRAAIRDCHVVLVCLSQQSISKTGYVQKEIRFALDRADEMPEGAVYVIPVCLEACTVPSRLEKWQRVDISIPQGLDRLRRVLKKLAVDLGLR